MWTTPHTRFRKLRRWLTLAAIACSALWMAAVLCWVGNIGPGIYAPAICAVLAMGAFKLLPLEEIRNVRLAVKGWKGADSVVDLTRAASLAVLFFWLQSMPEFWALEERMVNRTLWDWRPLLAVALWVFIHAYRNCVAIRSLSDRQIFRYYQGEAGNATGEQTFTKIKL